jgi:SAM-dependent methyltransferase
VGWAKRKRRVHLATNGEVKINLGCGLHVAPGWINIDGSLNALIASSPAWLHPVAYKLSGSRQYYTKDAYCAILGKHVFIHHNLAYGIPLQDKTTDFVYSSHFLEHLDKQSGRRLLEECWRVLRPGGVLRLAVPDLELAWEMYRRGDKEQMIHDFFFAEEATGFAQHRYAYDFAMLRDLLSEIGFDEIRRAKFQEGATPDLDILDNREDYTLFVEARRPAELPAAGRIEKPA